MPKIERRELETIDQVCRDVRSEGKLSSANRERLLTQFTDRFKNAVDIVKRRRVRRILFKPSGRVIWSVQGRKAEYQVIPDTNFCNCDDYYFRVMDRKRGLCYHIIAQRLAAALDHYEEIRMPDRDYGRVTERWKPREVAEE